MKAYVKDDYSFARIVARLRKKSVPELSRNEAIAGDDAWMCTTCRACVEECPLGINNLDIIREIRTSKIEEGTKVPALVGETLESLFKYGNPYQGAKNKRADWTQGLEIKDLSKKGTEADVLYFVGCGPSYDGAPAGDRPQCCCCF